MSKLKTGVALAVVCLIAALLFAQAASRLTEPTELSSTPSEVTTASKIPTMS